MRTVLILSIVGICFIASSALAYDDLVSNDGGFTPAEGRKTGNVRLVYQSAGDQFDTDGEKQELADDTTDLRVVLKGQYSIMENLGAFVILPFDKWDMGDAGESGLADIWIGAKYKVMDAFNIRAALDLPIGDDDKGLGNAGGFGIDVAAAKGKRIDKIGVRGQLGLRYNAEDSDTKWAPGIGVYFEGGVGYSLNEKVSGGIALEIMNVGDGQADGNDVDDSGVNSIELKIGGSYLLAEKMNCSVGILYDLTGKNTNADFGIRIGLGYRFSE